MHWTIYILRCGDGSLYTGVTNDLGRRLTAHALGRGAAYTRGRAPFSLVYRESARTRGAALKREWAIKQLSRSEKELLIVSARRQRQGTPPEFFGFQPAAMDFFRRLKRRNSREWFEAHRAMYEVHVKEPMRGLIEEMDVRFARFAPEMVGDPRHSMFRIYRDVRFAKDKSPYKTHAACWFYHHDAGRGVGTEAHGGAGFYLHLAPDRSSVGAGIWMPPRPALAKLRDALVENQRGFERVVLSPAVRRRFGPLDDEAMLKRLPRGFAEGHPASRWLRYQSFTIGRELRPTEVLSPKLAAVLERDYRLMLPLVRWLNEAMGFDSLKRRV